MSSTNAFQQLGVTQLLSQLPPSDRLSGRMQDALSQLGTALVMEFYDALRACPLDPHSTSHANSPPTSANGNLSADRWSNDEILFLRKSINRRPFPEIAASLGRTQKAVQLKAKKLGLRKGVSGNPWRPRDVNYLNKHYASQTVAEIARKLGRTSASVSNKALKLGLVRFQPELPAHRAVWTDAEVAYLRDHADDDLAEVAAALGRSMRAVSMKCHVEGIRRTKVDADKEARNAKILELRAKGLKPAQISERLGVSASIVSAVTRGASSREGNSDLE